MIRQVFNPFTGNIDYISVEESSSIVHNDTYGLQGGDEDEYFHLSFSQYSELHVPVTLDKAVDDVLSLSTQELGLVVQNPNLVFAGPVSGAAAVPTFRTLVAGDIPDLSATYLPLTGGTMTGDLYMGKNGVYFDRGSVGVDFERGSGGMYFDHGELKFYDTLLSLTLSEMGLPKLITLVATGQTEGDKHLTDALWAVSKAKIDTIRIVTASTNWDLYLLQNDNGYAADDARIPKLQLMKSGNGNAVIQLGQAYEDEDGTNEVHLYFNDIAGSNTFSVYIQGYQLR